MASIPHIISNTPVLPCQKSYRGWKVSTVDAKTRLVINTLKMSSCNINTNEKQLDYGFENNCNNTPQLYIAYCADG